MSSVRKAKPDSPGALPGRRFDGPVEGFNPTRFGRTLHGRGFFLSYAEQFSAEGDTRIGHSGPSRRLVKKGFTVDDAMVADFKKFVTSKNLKIEEDAWTKDVEFIRAMIRYAIDESVFDIATAKQHLITVDEHIVRHVYLRPGQRPALGGIQWGRA